MRGFKSLTASAHFDANHLLIVSHHLRFTSCLFPNRRAAFTAMARRRRKRGSEGRNEVKSSFSPDSYSMSDASDGYRIILWTSIKALSTTSKDLKSTKLITTLLNLSIISASRSLSLLGWYIAQISQSMDTILTIKTVRMAL